MLRIVFRYRDDWHYGHWRIQRCEVPSVEECIRIYGLGTDCEYEIISVEEI